MPDITFTLPQLLELLWNWTGNALHFGLQCLL